MGIYSANRTGRLGVQPATLKENYTSADANRIMYECVVNDNKIFEAILANDFREIKSMREGTLLESERVALNEASIKNLIESLKKHLSNFLGKIVNMVKAAITKISAYILRDGKAFVKNYNEFMSKHSEFRNSSNAVKVTGRVGYKLVDTPDVSTSEIEDIIKKNKNRSDKISKSDVINTFLGGQIGKSFCDPKTYRSIRLGKALNASDISTAGGSDTKLCKLLENASDAVKSLRDAENKAKKSIKQIANSLKEAEKMNNKDNADDVVKNITTLVGAGESIITTVVSTQVAIVKAQITGARKALGALMAKVKEASKGNKGSDSDDAVKEAAIDAEAEVADAFDEVPGEDPSVDMDPELASEIDDTVAAVEGECC